MTDYRAKAEEIERSNTPLANLYAAFAVYDLLKEVLDRLAPRPTPEPASVPPHLDSTCVCGSVDDFHLPACYEPAPADVDPDEAWARERWAESANIASWSALHPETQRVLVDFARAAREHIEAEADDADFSAASLHYARAERAEADLARVTDARDRHSRAADKWCNLYADKCEEIESVQAKADRYDALREDVSERRWDNSVLAGDRAGYATVVLRGILISDDERAGR